MMKLKIMDYCIRCGMCEDYFPELFHFDLEEDCIKVLHDEIPAELEDKAKEMIRDCAIAAIHIVR